MYFPFFMLRTWAPTLLEAARVDDHWSTSYTNVFSRALLLLEYSIEASEREIVRDMRVRLDKLSAPRSSCVATTFSSLFLTSQKQLVIDEFLAGVIKRYTVPCGFVPQETSYLPEVLRPLAEFVYEDCLLDVGPWVDLLP